MNADDRLSLDPLGRVEGGDCIVEGSHVADVCPQPTIPDPLDELTQLGAIGYDDEVDSQAARGPRLGRPGNGHQRSSGANHARRPLRDVAAEDIENQIDPADSPCHAVRPGITRAAPSVKSTSPGSGARLRASTATYSARVPSRVQSVRPNTRCPTDSPVVP